MRIQLTMLSALMACAPLLAGATADSMQSTDTMQSSMSSKWFEGAALSVEGFSISKANVTNNSSMPKMGYSQWLVKLDGVNRAPGETKPSCTLGVGVKGSNLNWRSNTYFRDRAIYNLVLDGSHVFDYDLPFKLHTDGYVELGLESSQITRYSLGIFDVYGSHSWGSADLFLGAHAQLGRHSYRLLPVVGVTLPMQSHFMLDIFFPYYGKVSYNVTEPCELFFAVRSIYDRQRVKDSDPTSRGIWEYKAYTASVGSSYRYQEMIDGSLEIGRSLSPKLRCYNNVGDELALYKTKGSFFAQVALSVMF